MLLVLGWPTSLYMRSRSGSTQAKICHSKIWQKLSKTNIICWWVLDHILMQFILYDLPFAVKTTPDKTYQTTEQQTFWETRKHSMPHGSWQDGSRPRPNRMPLDTTTRTASVALFCRIFSPLRVCYNIADVATCVELWTKLKTLTKELVYLLSSRLVSLFFPFISYICLSLFVFGLP